MPTQPISPAFPDAGFGAPPVWELAISAMTTSPILDPYDVRGVHDLYRGELPIVVRQAPVMHLQIAGHVGFAPPVTSAEHGLPPRWWFESSDSEHLLQMQEHFVASNWRRRHARPGEQFRYPGFDHIFGDFKARLAKLRDHLASIGSVFPPPGAGELLYDNLIPLVLDDGTKLPISEVLTEYSRVEPRLSLGFQMHWLERIDGTSESDRSVLQIEVATVAVLAPQMAEPTPVLKLQFTAGAVRETWDDLFAFFETAHAHIRHRLMVLTTEGTQVRWLPR